MPAMTSASASRTRAMPLLDFWLHQRSMSLMGGRSTTASAVRMPASCTHAAPQQSCAVFECKACQAKLPAGKQIYTQAQPTRRHNLTACRLQIHYYCMKASCLVAPLGGHLTMATARSGMAGHLVAGTPAARIRPPRALLHAHLQGPETRHGSGFHVPDAAHAPSASNSSSSSSNERRRMEPTVSTAGDGRPSRGREGIMPAAGPKHAHATATRVAIAHVHDMQLAIRGTQQNCRQARSCFSFPRQAYPRARFCTVALLHTHLLQCLSLTLPAGPSPLGSPAR